MDSEKNWQRTVRYSSKNDILKAEKSIIHITNQNLVGVEKQTFKLNRINHDKPIFILE